MKRVLLAGFLWGIVALPLFAGIRSPSVLIPIRNYVVQDTNRWRIAEDNAGMFVYPLGGNSGGSWSGRGYLFGGGIWIGCMDTTDQDTVVAWGYNPNSGASNLGPCLPNGDTTGAGTDSLARIYDSSLPRDTTQWPERDSLGRAIIQSDQELWAICSGLYQRPPDRPLGVVSVRRSMAWNSPGPWGDIVKMEFEVKNVTGRYQPPARTLKKVIIGLCLDADIGNEGGIRANDQCYLDRTSGSPFPNLAVQYQTAQELGWGPPPYYVGMKFVSGPTNNTLDTIRIRSNNFPAYNRDVLPGQPLGMTAFKLFTLTTDPSTAPQRYLELAGYYYLNPTVYEPYDNDFPGPSDHRFLLSCGPFNLPNDSTVRVTAHIIGATDSLDLIRKAELVGVESTLGQVARNASGVVLFPSVPNPNRGSCLICYFLPEPSPVTLRVYDVSGRLVRELEKGMRSVGANSVRWDGRDESGRPVAGGVYFYRLEVSEKYWVKKTVLLR